MRRAGIAIALAVVAGGTPVQAQVSDDPRVTTVRVESPVQLAEILKSDFRGRIVVPRDADWTMERSCVRRDAFGRCVDEPFTYLPVRRGVDLVGERGALGSRPVLRAAYGAESYPLFTVEEGGVRIEGLELVGPRNPRDRFKDLPSVGAIKVVQDAPKQRPLRTLIADNEITRFNVAISVEGARGGFNEPTEYCAGLDPCLAPFPSDAALARIERNYIHTNVVGPGYGVVVGGGAYATVEGNVFEFHNHAIAASGYAFSGYVARFNYILRGVYTYGEDRTLGHNIDVHGRGRAETRNYAGGRAGTYFEVSQNTILGSQDYGFAGRLTRAAFGLRGRPAQGAHFVGNVLTHDDFDEAIKLRGGDDETLDEDRPATFNLRTAGTRYSKDYSRELASGDFDGDGRTDAFVANGTGWFFSRAGVRHWEFLRASTARTRDLVFADVDGDRVTDVLLRDGGGRIGYLKSGRGDRVELTSAPVPMSDVRSGDFDGDGRADLFYTHRGQWRVWYARTRTWAEAATSAKPIGELLFGEFDAVRGTDVVGINGDGWAYSSAATAGWARLNARLTRSFAGARAADLDGNGRTDIVVADGDTWRWSRGGRGALVRLVKASSLPRLAGTLVGRFDGGTRDVIVGLPDDRLVVLRAAQSRRGLDPLSAQNMR